METSQASTFIHELLNLFLYMGSEWVLYLLIVLSVVSLAIAFERIVYFARRGEDMDELERNLDEQLKNGDIDVVKERLAKSRSHVATIIGKGLGGWGLGASTIEDLLTAAGHRERLRMERGLAFLGTLGNNAPFIGLFGTVLGIIRAFQDLSLSAADGSTAVMAGIAEALVATAVGLLVALPSVALFNYFGRRIRTQMSAVESVSRILLAYNKAERA